MRRQGNRLTVTTIKAAIRHAPEEGKKMLADGNGLYAQIKNQVPSWIFRYALNGRTGNMGLGPIDPDNIDLAAARERANDARRLKRTGIDPLAHRRADRQTRLIAAAKAVPTFAECSRRYYAAHRSEWKSAKHAAQWLVSLETHVYPTFGHLPVNVIDVGLVMQALETLWQEKPATASRVRARIENILDWATALKYRQGDNPARWKENLKKLLADPAKVKVTHYAALPHDAIAALMTELRQHDGVAYEALTFLILTAVRTGEVLGARWDEFDTPKRLWTVPALRVKGGKKEHRVALSASAVAIFERMKARRSSDFVFPGARHGRPLGEKALRNALAELAHGAGATVHGFRSTFCDWVAEETEFPNELAELALAHTVGTKVEQAYRRSDMFAKRRHLAEAWAAHCDGTEPTGQVVSLDAHRR